MSLVVGADGLPRCSWAGPDEVYVAYHDLEWGRPVRDERRLFEKLCLESFQSGLSWLVILRKREGFRAAFAGFEPEAVAAFGEADVTRLLADAGIVRNRAKILATITNARALATMHAAGESLSDLLWSHAPPWRPRPRRLEDLPPWTPGSKAAAKALKRRGFTFVGPTTTYALMQACGLVDDHVEGCHVPRAEPLPRRTAQAGR